MTDSATTAAWPVSVRPPLLVVDALHRNGATVINLELARHWAAGIREGAARWAGLGRLGWGFLTEGRTGVGG